MRRDLISSICMENATTPVCLLDKDKPREFNTGFIAGLVILLYEVGYNLPNYNKQGEAN